LALRRRKKGPPQSTRFQVSTRPAQTLVQGQEVGGVVSGLLYGFRRSHRLATPAKAFPSTGGDADAGTIFTSTRLGQIPGFACYRSRSINWSRSDMLGTVSRLEKVTSAISRFWGILCCLMRATVSGSRFRGPEVHGTCKGPWDGPP